jgi:hypothetical protein
MTPEEKKLLEVHDFSCGIEVLDRITRDLLRSLFSR